jgi:RNA polymerase sigma-70 factor (ECF subfamily)
MVMTTSMVSAVQAGRYTSTNESTPAWREAMTEASRPAQDREQPPVVEGVIGADVLFREHARFVATFLVRLGAPPQSVEDLVQEVFLVAHRLGGSTNDAAKPTTWLAMIALRVLSHDRRTRRRHPEVFDETTLASAVASSPNQEDVVHATESLTLVGRALQTLDLEKRALFILFELEEESCESIAAGLGIPIATVYSRLRAARQEVRTEYARLSRDQVCQRSKRSTK